MATHEEMESAFGVKGVGKLKKGFGKNKVGVYEDFNGDLLAGGSFTEFLHSGGLEIEEQFCRAEMGLVYSPSFSHKPSVHQEHASKMLSFHTNQNRTEMGFWETGDTATAMAQKSVISGSDSSSTSSSNNSRSRSWTAESGEATTEPKRRNGLEPGSGSVSGSATGSLVHGSEDNRITFKKPKRESAICTGTLKVRKEKLGERISALQQLVSPFGKTDTASVLHEAIGYIRFLHDQVQVLSSPYLQITPSSNISPGDWGEENKYDLRSRGLCLVPVACTLHVASSNGADFWASAMGRSASKH